MIYRSSFFFAGILLFQFLIVNHGVRAKEASEHSLGIDARMLRYPDVSENQIAFVYAGDIWVVAKQGGLAQRLSSPRGEETFPRFSPDGTQIAFSGNYDGNIDLYVMPASGGLPKRLTFHGAPDRMLGWYPDGKSILFASTRASEKDRFNQLYKISAEGGLPEKLPLPYGEFGAISPDGKALAYTPISVDFRTWKRYRGGMNSAIWLFNLENFESQDLTGNEAGNSQPMWHGKTLYFLSDRDKNKRANIWACEAGTKKFRQVTTFEEFDIHFPSIGPKEMVFENGGRLFLLNLETEKYEEVDIRVVTDRATLKPRLEDVTRSAREADVSPSGKRIVLEARGEIFTVPAEHGVIRNLTRTPGAAEHFPAWSPDGKSIAYFSDRSGEYQLCVRAADGSGEEEVLTKFGPGYRYRPFWSPDSKKLIFIDQSMTIHFCDVENHATHRVSKQLSMYHDSLSKLKFNWSPDSRWVAFAQDTENQHTVIAIYDTDKKKLHKVTSGFYDDDSPIFDGEGKYLFYRSGRNFSPVYSDVDNTWIYPNTYQLVSVPLREETPSLLAARNDDEGSKPKKKSKSDKDKDKKPDPAKDKEKDKAKPVDPRKKDEPKLEPTADAPEKSKADPKSDKKDKDKDKDQDKSKEEGASEKDSGKEEKTAKNVGIDFENFEARAVILPPKPGYFSDLISSSKKLLYRRIRQPDTEKSSLDYFDFEKREEKTVLDDVDQAIMAAKGEKILVRRKGEYCLIEPKEAQKFEKKVPVNSLEMMVDPAAEWSQIFQEAWRLERDYFYDPHMHGVDWEGMRKRYGALLKDAVTRWDVNYVIGELIAELSSSHTYRSGGDVERELQQGVGYLGVDYSLEKGCYRFKKIIDGARWDAEERSPLKEPGLEVQEGDYLLAVNGLPLAPEQEPYAAFQGLADKAVFLTVNDRPTMDGAHDILVRTLSSEYRLRHLAWIEKNRKRVEEATGGKVGYVYVPDTGRPGQSELVRQFRAQFNKDGLIIDERFNSGGQIPDRFIELLSRKTLNYWGVRDGADWSWPQIAHSGPKAMLVNGWSGSGGDCFPFYFQKAGLGPVIGARTWGGLIGITGTPPLMDDGQVTVPSFGIYSTAGEWIVEGHGVDPDIPVVDNPSLMAKGEDPQLARAISEVMKSLKKRPPAAIKKPKYPVRAGY